MWNNGVNYSGCFPGTGDISVDPLYTGGIPFDYHLQSTSPCIDTGDPNFPQDPDLTAADMGAFFYNQGGCPVVVTLTPENPPIQIPASGGTFGFNIAVENTGANQVNIDIWTMATLPTGGGAGPLINVDQMNFAAGFGADRDREQAVPAFAPSGTYTYHAYVGVYPASIWNEDEFEFEKLETFDGGEIYSNWDNWGEEFNFAGSNNENWSSGEVLPESINIMTAYPNPFNQETTISFQLPESGNISLIVYNSAGREISSLLEGWHSTGIHECYWNASGLASGMYLVRLIGEGFNETDKLLLIK